MTLYELFEAAKVGFKEPWEFTPEGYRLVTEEEKKTYKHQCPQDADCLWFSENSNQWYRNTYKAFSKEPHAVPIDFVFDDKERKKAELVAKAQELLKQAEEL